MCVKSSGYEIRVVTVVTVKHPHLLQGCDRGTFTTVVWISVHMQNFLPIHGHDPRENTFLHK